MTTKTTAAADVSRCFAIMMALIVAAPIYGQATAPITPTAAQLTKYDKNKNGKLDPDELAEMEKDQAKEKEGAVTMSPFTVTTDKDVGYVAGNSLSGGRVDTPLAI